MALDCPLKIDCLAVSSDAADSSEASDVTEKKILYVQSISRWAPANIGPYSQAVKVIVLLLCVVFASALSISAY